MESQGPVHSSEKHKGSRTPLSHVFEDREEHKAGQCPLPAASMENGKNSPVGLSSERRRILPQGSKINFKLGVANTPQNAKATDKSKEPETGPKIMSQEGTDLQSTNPEHAKEEIDLQAPAPQDERLAELAKSCLQHASSLGLNARDSTMAQQDVLPRRTNTPVWNGRGKPSRSSAAPELGTSQSGREENQKLGRSSQAPGADLQKNATDKPDRRRERSPSTNTGRLGREGRSGGARKERPDKAHLRVRDREQQRPKRGREETDAHAATPKARGNSPDDGQLPAQQPDSLSEDKARLAEAMKTKREASRKAASLEPSPQKRKPDVLSVEASEPVILSVSTHSHYNCR